MLFKQETIKLRPLVLGEQPDGDALHNLGFIGKIKMGENHAASLGSRPEKVQSFFMLSFVHSHTSYPDKSAMGLPQTLE